MIREFQGEYRWLSNFAPVKIVLEGIEYSSVEHAYMSAKSDDKTWKLFCANSRNSPGEVKRRSKTITLVDYWESKKVGVMYQCLLQKYHTFPYIELLMATGNEHIQEGNRWGDTFWGVCLKTNKGQNTLGNLIMKIRDELNQK